MCGGECKDRRVRRTLGQYFGRPFPCREGGWEGSSLRCKLEGRMPSSCASHLPHWSQNPSQAVRELPSNGPELAQWWTRATPALKRTLLLWTRRHQRKNPNHTTVPRPVPVKGSCATLRVASANFFSPCGHPCSWQGCWETSQPSRDHLTQFSSLRPLALTPFFSPLFQRAGILRATFSRGV